MEVLFSSQLQGFLYACVVGAILAAGYDVFRIWRILFSSSRLVVLIQDILFFACAAVVTFLLALAVNFGELRFYILAGEIAGACVYFLTLGEVTARLARLIYRFLGFCKRQIIRLVVFPLERFIKSAVQKGKISIKERKSRKNSAKLEKNS